jgi:hypothetical protein
MSQSELLEEFILVLLQIDAEEAETLQSIKHQEENLLIELE